MGRDESRCGDEEARQCCWGLLVTGCGGQPDLFGVGSWSHHHRPWRLTPFDLRATPSYGR